MPARRLRELRRGRRAQHVAYGRVDRGLADVARADNRTTPLRTAGLSTARTGARTAEAVIDTLNDQLGLL
ncbi:hypothetical protein ACFWR9_01035 [Streptomyces sp. NPDC058534]|uniref:hypothetical protein n=1 Tax=Streptomyces sp. NPDC058534 TaxID=3346541 RepID=UPI003649A6E1